MADRTPIKNPTWAELRKLCLDPELILGFAGPPGVGKTQFCFWAAKRMKKKCVEKVQFHEELSPIEIMGATYPSVDGNIWFPGAGDLCYTKGGLLILDELDMASGPCKTLCYSLLDRGPGRKFTYLGRRFEPRDGYQAWATMNGNPLDGTLPPAMLDRFDAWFMITEPCEEQYAELEEDLEEQCRLAYAQAKDPLAGPAFTYRMFRSLQYWRERQPLDQAILSATHGDQELAYAMYEVLTIEGDGDDDDED